MNNSKIVTNLSMPFVVERNADGERSYDLESRLLVDRNVFIETPFDDNMAFVSKAKFLWLDSRGTEDITLYISSPGGHVTSGLGIKDCIESLRSDVKTVCFGSVCSMGCYIFSTAGAEGKRHIGKRGTIMAHQVSGGQGGSHIQDQIISLEHTKFLNELLMKEIADRVGVSLDQLMNDAYRDLWLNAEQSLNYGKYGFADSIVTGKRNDKGQYEVERRNGKFEFI